ncbi:glycine--tRNA ligase subunit beta [Pseudohalioglobus sediminis]|uniref:Glycine--tRNA ligase beta subunit n=1 Tax=Pseudohalioglobus sediminis TaxID=2606449 RepID=A0A5B0WWP6_9GAMM|nr:glycine--tRNA ligase subunit beta [Pseudohalioglobus sediminis]KAA1190561.1 glycine--tRNA ligase subunit beta [Pseudohalioglobus sediminis]
MTTETLLIELGTEELPPKALKSLGLAFRDGIVTGLAGRELGHGEVRWFASPRRLAVQIAAVQVRGADKDIEVLGPPVDRARDQDGNWTPAAAGFARKQGVEADALEVIDTPKGARLGLRKTEAGVATSDCLNDIIHEAIAALPIPKRMRWGASRVEFVRPVHWVVAMLGEKADHGLVLGLPTGNTTRGHRFHSSGDIVLEKPEDYEQALADAKVVASFEQRQQMIRDQVEVEASALNARAVIDPDLLDEVTGLVEWPVALTGSFEERFLEVPAEALVSSMKEHQKYFHLVDEEGNLKPNFITLCNIESEDPVQVIAGNERVIRPRLADAAFFFETDKKTPLSARVQKLESVVFQQKLGTVADKTRRVQRLAGALALKIGAPVEQAERAALLAKTDLVTEMVLEFSDMQGIAGSYYALHDGEAEDVAAAIAQQYWPKFAGDRLPQSGVACALGLADRLDTLVGIFGIGQPPTGSKDPFALRRASLAVLRIIVEKGLDLDLRDCLELAAGQYPDGVLADGTVAQVLDYMIERFRAWFEEDGIAVEVFRAVAAQKLSRPLDIQRRVLAVHAFSQLPEATALAAANKRVSNILGKLDPSHPFGNVSTDLLAEAAEKDLAVQLQSLSAVADGHLQQAEYREALASLAALRAPVDQFFDDVMVNAEDQALRNNRLNLLKQLRDQFLAVADISQLVVSK